MRHIHAYRSDAPQRTEHLLTTHIEDSDPPYKGNFGLTDSPRSSASTGAGRSHARAKSAAPRAGRTKTPISLFNSSVRRSCSLRGVSRCGCRGTARRGSLHPEAVAPRRRASVADELSDQRGKRRWEKHGAVAEREVGGCSARGDAVSGGFDNPLRGFGRRAGPGRQRRAAVGKGRRRASIAAAAPSARRRRVCARVGLRCRAAQRTSRSAASPPAMHPPQNLAQAVTGARSVADPGVDVVLA